MVTVGHRDVRLRPAAPHCLPLPRGGLLRSRVPDRSEPGAFAPSRLRWRPTNLTCGVPFLEPRLPHGHPRARPAAGREPRGVDGALPERLGPHGCGAQVPRGLVAFVSAPSVCNASPRGLMPSRQPHWILASGHVVVWVPAGVPARVPARRSDFPRQGEWRFTCGYMLC